MQSVATNRIVGACSATLEPLIVPWIRQLRTPRITRSNRSGLVVTLKHNMGDL
jgi:hypothetical protein